MPPNEGTQGDDLLKLRFEYAWCHFEYHAKQRITMFHFFLIITGILANAYVLLLGKNFVEIAKGIAFIGAFISLGFFALDWRNTQLVKMGEEILEKLEEENIFTKKFKVGENNQGHQLGFLYREAEEKRLLNEKRQQWRRRRKWKEDPGWLQRTFLFRWLRDNSVKHKVWIRSIEIIVGVSFILAAVLPIFLPAIFQVQENAG